MFWDSCYSFYPSFTGTSLCLPLTNKVKIRFFSSKTVAPTFCHQFCVSSASKSRLVSGVVVSAQHIHTFQKCHIFLFFSIFNHIINHIFVSNHIIAFKAFLLIFSSAMLSLIISLVFLLSRNTSLFQNYFKTDIKERVDDLITFNWFPRFHFHRIAIFFDSIEYNTKISFNLNNKL